MKKYIYLFSFLVIAFSCKKKETTITPKEEITKVYSRVDVTSLLKEKITASKEAGEIQKRAILEHDMGMKKDTAYRHIRRLYKKGKMKKIRNKKGNNEYVYTLQTRRFGAVNMFFDAFYDDKKRLYMIECRPEKIKDTEVGEFMDEITELMTEKYSKASFHFENEPCEGKIWLDKTLIIETFCQSDELVLQYKDGTNLYNRNQDL